ncbi:MAG: T9SS type A sorting domain-containing protein [Bacteroidota bacterium]
MRHIFTLAILLSSFTLLAQTAYEIDPTFQLDAIRPGATSYVVKQQADGKLLVGGDFDIVEGSNLTHLVRLNADGTLDQSFNPNGTGPSDDVQDIEILDDGKILIAMSQALYYNGESVPAVYRLNSDGSLDNTFQADVFLNNNQRFNNSVFALDVQADGKIIVAGAFSSIGTAEANGIARLNADGSLDNTFSTGIGLRSNFEPSVVGPASQVALLSSGSVAVIGAFDTYDGSPANTFAILGTDGSLEITVPETLEDFVFPSLFDAEGFLIEQADGKIIVSRDDNDFDKRLIRLNTDGTIDDTFNSALNDESVVSLASFSDGRLLIKSRNVSAITDADGVIDGSVTLPDAERFYLTDDNTIIAQTSVNDIGFRLERYDASGNQQTFNSPRFYEVGRVNDLIKETDNTFLFIGRMNFRDGADFSETTTVLSRISIDGTIDNGFSPEIDGFAQGVVIDDDGAIWLWGDISAIDNQAVSNMVKLNPDGSIDNTFDTGTGFDRVLEEVRIQNDGKLVVVGDFEDYNGSSAPNIIRLNPDGSIDNTYLIGTGFNRARPEGLELQPDGKALVFDGNIEEYNGTPTGQIVRLNTDGTLDNTFDIGLGFQNSFVVADELIAQETITILENGQMLIGGEFDSFNGHATQGLARINSDGSVDTDFVANISQLDNYVGIIRDIELTEAGDIIATGIFETADNTLSRSFVQLDANGGFVQSFGFEKDILVLGEGVLIDNDSIYLFGGFRGVAGDNYSGIVRFVEEVETVVSIEEISSSIQNIYPNPTRDKIIIPNEYQIKTYTIRDNTGKVLLTQSGDFNQIDVSQLRPGVFLLELIEIDNTSRQVRIIKE